MDAVKFLQEQKRMCDSVDSCTECGIYELVHDKWDNHLCQHLLMDADEAVDIVEKWSKEHPIKTNGVRFKEVYGYSFESLYNSAIIHESGTCNASILAEWLSSPYEEPKEDA